MTSYIKKNNLKRNLVVAGQYILEVTKRFIEIVKLELKEDKETQVKLSLF